MAQGDIGAEAAPKPEIVIGTREQLLCLLGFGEGSEPFAEVAAANGLLTRRLPTDHPNSDRRIVLQTEALSWLSSRLEEDTTWQ